MRHILLVDDEDSIRNTFAIFLQRAGHQVTTARDVGGALRELHNSSFDCIVTDIVLPDEHGMHLLHEVKRQGHHAPVIMITGQPTLDNATESLRQGAFDYLLKPVKREELLRATQKALEYKDLLDGKQLLQEENARYRLHLEELVHERTQQLTKANANLRREIEERQLAEASLRQHQERLDLAMEISGVAAFESQPGKMRFICDERMAEITGVPLQELQEFHHNYSEWLNSIHPEDRERFHEALVAIQEGHADTVDEIVRLKRPDGKWVHIHGLARAVERLPYGRAARIVGVVMDISSRMRSNELLRQQRDLGLALSSAESQSEAGSIIAKALHELVDLELFGLYTFDHGDQELQLLHCRGFSEQEVSLLNRYDTTTPQYKFLKTGEPLYSLFNVMQNLHDSSLDHLGLKATAILPLLHEKKLLGAMCLSSRTVEHISNESKYMLEALASQVASALASLQALEALRASEAKYRNLIDTIPHGVVEMDLDGMILFCNQITAARQGRSPEELQGLPVHSLMATKEQQEAFCSYLEKAKREKLSPEPFSFQVRDTDGNIVELQADWNWNHDDAGNLRGITSVVTDVTARKRAENALQQAHEELELRVRERTRELHETSQQLRRLAARQGEIIEEERKRIAREIHDELGQNLTALNMGLSVLGNILPQDEQQLQTRINVLRSTLEQMIKAVQRICQELRPMQLDDLGLGAAMAWRIRDFQEATGVSTVLTLQQDDIEVPPEMGTAVYRLVQEALTNAVRHANPSRINVTLKQKTENLEVTVQDDGAGIDENMLHSRDSFGLLGMRERMHSVGGSLEIHGHKGKGTTVLATFPLDFSRYSTSESNEQSSAAESPATPLAAADEHKPKT